jgi:hypothetical protein
MKQIYKILAYFFVLMNIYINLLKAKIVQLSMFFIYRLIAYSEYFEVFIMKKNKN